MEAFRILTIPAHLAAWRQVVIVVLTALAVWVTGSSLVSLVSALALEDAWTRAVLAMAAGILMLIGLGFLWWLAADLQALLMYHLRDRGKQVVMFSLDANGWWWQIAGADVLMPWAGLTASVVGRDEEHFTLKLTPATVRRIGRDPQSRRIARILRRRGCEMPMTHTDPTEAELAEAVERLSGGRVELVRT